tara:strand:- start:3693 stop:4007 length:315 start_codon:yes stop_codon:yes gene_type:complete
VYNIDDPANGVYELTLARKTKGQVLFAVFTLFGDKWLKDIENIAIDEDIEVSFVIRAKSYTDKKGKERWSNNLIVSKLKYGTEPKLIQSNMYSKFDGLKKHYKK